MQPKNGIRTAGNPYLNARTASLQMFAGIEHRMESVKSVNGVEFINDSKSTDIESSYYSLELVEAPLTWIVGATELETDYSHVLKFVKYKVVNLIVFGKSSDESIFNTYSCIVDCYIKKDTLKDAFDEAVSKSKTGAVVLFSPACNSFDEYEDYLERGEEFKKLVNNLK
jgi:UDP-N-acetylmuramoylalanine--D-glutamate ligase